MTRDDEQLKRVISQAVGEFIADAMLIEGIKYPEWPTKESNK